MLGSEDCGPKNKGYIASGELVPKTEGNIENMDYHKSSNGD